MFVYLSGGVREALHGWLAGWLARGLENGMILRFGSVRAGVLFSFVFFTVCIVCKGIKAPFHSRNHGPREGSELLIHTRRFCIRAFFFFFKSSLPCCICLCSLYSSLKKKRREERSSQYQ